MMQNKIFPVRFPLDKQARSQAPGNFIDLPNGKVHYEQTGPSGAPPLVLVHGLSVPGFVWDPVFKPLGRIGFRVTRFDLFGRGFSDRPKGDYDVDFFTRQLTRVLDALGLTQPIYLAGVSMGGVITGNFALTCPERIDTLTLVNAAGMMPEPKGISRILSWWPGIAEARLHFLGTNLAVNGLQDDFHAMKPPAQYIEKVRQQLKFKGFNQALLSTLRSGILYHMAPMYKALGKTRCSIRLIWGLEDRVVPFDSCEKLKNYLPHARFFPVEKAGHLPQYERPNQVLEIFSHLCSGQTPA